MEGGYKPWKVQNIIDNSPDLDSYGKPLPPPPPGYFWERRENLSWELMRFESTPVDAQVNFTNPSVVEHVVLPGDTIQGLCLRYRVSAVELRRHNNFSGNNIQFSASLRIPIEHELPVSIQLDTNEVKLQRFKNITHEDAIESSFYLDEHKWDLDNALIAWKEDKVWNDTHFYPNGAQSNEIPDDFLSESTHETKRSSKRFSLSRIISSKSPVSNTKAPGTIEPFMIIQGPTEIITNAVEGIECEMNEDDSDIYVVQAADSWKQPKYQNSSSEKMKNTILSLFGRKNSVSDNDNLINLDEGAVDPVLRPLMSDDHLQRNQPVLL